MTSQQITLNLLAELIPGYMLPGRPIAVMAFKTFCVQALGSGLTFTQDLKLGHYMKLPPRITFTVQIVCGIISCLVQIGTKAWLESAVPDLCSPEQATKALLVCPIGGVFFSSSIIWCVVPQSDCLG
jgi:nucleoside recognition membrane protein YjiH